MRRYILSFFLIIIATIAVSFIPYQLEKGFFDILFAVVGIFYSIGYSVVLGFDFSRIKNRELTQELKKNVRNVGTSFTVFFGIGVFIFCVSNYCFSSINSLSFKVFFFHFSVTNFLALLFLYVLFYLVYNFCQLQKLKDDLDNQIRNDSDKLTS